MRSLLGFAAALIALTASPSAQARVYAPRPPGGAHRTPNVPPMPQVHHEFHSDSQMKDPNTGRPLGHRSGGFAAGYGYGAYDGYSEFDGNRSFDPDQWNDWWHERPDRAFPRWLSRNQDCSRLWYRADVLSC
jgi:hypothetical protein